MPRLPLTLLSFWFAFAPACFSAASRGTVEISIASANLSDSFSQSYEEPGIRILRALKPDVLGIQEFRSQTESPEALVERIFGPGYHFHREEGNRLPNGIVSRFPILAAGQWPDPFVDDRDFAWATLDVPGPVPLHVVSVHLLNNSPHNRLPQARALLSHVREQFAPGDYVVLCGDFNVSSRDSPALDELLGYFVDSPVPADQEGNPNTNASRTRPYDFVLPNPALAQYHAPSILGGTVFPRGLVFDSRLWNPPPPPVLWDDTSRNMQHLPVLKTFRIPR